MCVGDKSSCNGRLDVIDSRLFWPLYACGVDKTVSVMTADWVARQLSKMSKITGNGLATYLAHVLEEGSQPIKWQHIG